MTDLTHVTATEAELRQPLTEIPATVHDAEKAGWTFSNHIGFLMQEYEAALSELSDAQFAYDKAKTDNLPKIKGKNSDERDAQLFPLILEERKRLDRAKTNVEILKVWRSGRDRQLEWARSALSFMKSELGAASRNEPPF